MQDIEDIDEIDMYDPLYVQAYDFLKQHFQEPFVYKIWDEKGSVIGINDGKTVHIYHYKFDNNKLEILGG